MKRIVSEPTIQLHMHLHLVCGGPSAPQDNAGQQRALTNGFYNLIIVANVEDIEAFIHLERSNKRESKVVVRDKKIKT
jgi:hypothetical protein